MFTKLLTRAAVGAVLLLLAAAIAATVRPRPVRKRVRQAPQTVSFLEVMLANVAKWECIKPL